MFQSFKSTARPEQGPPRLTALRDEIVESRGLTDTSCRAPMRIRANMSPRRMRRLSWLTGFTGSAGFCIVLPKIAGVFIDGRYRTQVKAQVDLSRFFTGAMARCKARRLAEGTDEEGRQGRL